MTNNQEKIVFLVKSLLIFLIIFLIFLIVYNLSYAKVHLIFYLNGDDNVILTVNNEYKEEGFVAKLDKKNLKSYVKTKSDVNTKKLGEYLVKYSINLKYLNIKKDLVRKVRVIDDVKPELTVDSENTITLTVGDSYTKPTAKAKDNYDGDLTDKIKVFSNLDVSKAGTYEITYSVKDSSDNESTFKIDVTVKEKEKEKIKTSTIYNPTPANVPVTNAYIDVSISQQVLNYYENGQLVLSSPIVTGINNGTPTGDYQVLNKVRNTTLRGKDYTSYVNYWIAFIGSSYGFHDASWRSEFGGEIYKTNGSHGCVNMPYSSVSRLYELVQIGTPVHVRY